MMKACECRRAKGLKLNAKNVAINGTLAGVGIQACIQDNNHINQVKAGLNYRFMSDIW